MLKIHENDSPPLHEQDWIVLERVDMLQASKRLWKTPFG